MVRRKPIPRSHRSHFDASPEGKRNKKSSIIHKKKRLPVLKEIKHLRRTTHLLIPRLPFARLVREIILEIFPRQDYKHPLSKPFKRLRRCTSYNSSKTQSC
ncbi:histone H3-like centromeric protein hH3v isoform X4 [Harpegnathos saltator]|uniref:histone H3-like centromeric protein hH3v isoform X4 n=1 Tax=Harpegnathos saltator TaxID=610380 RepID=UPI00058B6D35|nr:histone H3-like centromeric protein hH3v isoform X4 [Harpegnathos saltator]